MSGQRLQVHIGQQGLALDVHFQDRLASLHIWTIHDHLAVETARAQQRRVQNVWPVGRRNNDDIRIGVEAIHLDQQLVERLLPFVVTAAQACAAMTADRVNFINENDAGAVALRLFE